MHKFKVSPHNKKKLNQFCSLSKNGSKREDGKYSFYMKDSSNSRKNGKR